MSGIKPFGALAIIAALGVFGIASATAGGHEGDRRERGGYVVPCSLAGVNPVYYPGDIRQSGRCRQRIWFRPIAGW